MRASLCSFMLSLESFATATACSAESPGREASESWTSARAVDSSRSGPRNASPRERRSGSTSGARKTSLGTRAKAGRAKACREIARGLAPGGTALISDFQKTKEYAAAFREAGMSVERSGPYLFDTFPPLRIVAAVKQSVLRNPMKHGGGDLGAASRA